MSPAPIRRQTFRKRGAVHEPPLICSQPKYGAGFSEIVAPYMVRPPICCRRNYCARLEEIVAPYMGRTSYGAGSSTAPELLAPYMGRTLYGAGSSTAPDFEKSLAPYMGPPSEIRVLYAPLGFSRYESSEILGWHTT